MRYRIIPVNIHMGEQLDPEFLAISPNNEAPAICDNAPANRGRPITVFECGAIRLYPADKCGPLISSDFYQRIAAPEWLFRQAGGLAPLAG